jgi:hypothetical protein
MRMIGSATPPTCTARCRDTSSRDLPPIPPGFRKGGHQLGELVNRKRALEAQVGIRIESPAAILVNPADLRLRIHGSKTAVQSAYR